MACGRWLAVRETAHWHLHPDDNQPVDAAATFAPETAWRVFTRCIPPQEARMRAHLTGGTALAAQTLPLSSLIM